MSAALTALTDKLRSAARRAPAWLPVVLAATAATLAALTLVDPRCLWLAWLPALLMGSALTLSWRSERRWVLFAGTLTVAYWIAALVGPVFRADSPGYYAYARSLLFDGDISFFNEWARWGRPPLPTSRTGLMMSAYSTGPALLWSPFILVSHIYVLLTSLLGVGGYSADGYSLPYLRATAVGTLTYATVAAWLLQSTLARRVSPVVAWVATVGGIATSPMLFYLFVCPSTSHGLTFALCAALLWALDTADRERSWHAWLGVGFVLGLLLSVRWQAIVVAVLPLAWGLRELGRRRVKLRWLLAASLAGVVAFSPQMLAWRVLYGEWVALPRTEAGVGRGGWWFAPESPRAWDVLFSAHHGLFTWTPLTLLFLLALVVSVRRWGLLGWGGLYVFAVTTWLNGSLGDWHGSDAFGARRFDVVIPFLCLGLASILKWLVARPMVAPIGALVLGTLWNVGLIRMFQHRLVPAAAPLEAVAANEAGQMRDLAERAGQALGGPRGRALAYNSFVGEFLFADLNPSGVIAVAAPGAQRYLSGTWSSPMNRRGPAHFRWATYPKSCVRFPLDWPASSLAGRVTARAHPRLDEVGVEVTLNHKPLGRFRLGTEWSRLKFTLPEASIVPGENLLCLEFSKGIPGTGFAAAVTRIQIGS